MRPEHTNLQVPEKLAFEAGSSGHDAGWQDTLTANSGIDVQAIRDAIGRLESEAKATVAAENRSRAESRARTLAEERARLDSAAGAAAHANARAAEEAIATSTALLKAEQELCLASENKIKALSQEIAALKIRTDIDLRAAAAAQERAAAEQAAALLADEQMRIDNQLIAQAQQASEQLVLATERSQQLAHERNLATQNAFLETEHRARADAQIIQMARECEQRERSARLTAETRVEALREAVAIAAQREQAEAAELAAIWQRTAADAAASEETQARIAAEQDRQRIAQATARYEQRSQDAILQHQQIELELQEAARRREHLAELALSTAQARYDAEETICAMHTRRIETETELRTTAELRMEAQAHAESEIVERLASETAAIAMAHQRVIAEQQASAAAALRCADEHYALELATQRAHLDREAAEFAQATAAAEAGRVSAAADYADLQSQLAAMSAQQLHQAQLLAAMEKERLDAERLASDALQSRYQTEQAAQQEALARAAEAAITEQLLQAQAHCEHMLRQAQEIENAALDVSVREANAAANMRQQAAQAAVEASHNAVALTKIAAQRVESEERELVLMQKKVLLEEQALKTSEVSAAALQTSVNAARIAEQEMQLRLKSEQTRSDLLLQQAQTDRQLRLAIEAEATALRHAHDQTQQQLLLQREAARLALQTTQAEMQAVHLEQQRTAAAHALHVATEQRCAAEQRRADLLQQQASEAVACANAACELALHEENALLAMQQKNDAVHQRKLSSQRVLHHVQQQRDTEQMAQQLVTAQLTVTTMQQDSRVTIAKGVLPLATDAIAHNVLSDKTTIRTDILQETAQLDRLHAQVERELELTRNAEQKMAERMRDHLHLQTVAGEV